MTAVRVLVVDDNAMNLELAEILLAHAAMEVATAGDGHSARTQVAAFRPDIVLMDIQLPDGDGLDVVREWRSAPATQGLMIVAFTAMAMAGDEERMLAAGCDGYLSKPIEARTFADQVRAFVRR